MGDERLYSARLLLIDTCGDPASVVLSEGARVRVSETLPRQRASAEIVVAIKRLLAAMDWRLTELQGIGVVSGPGSFTGVRTGLSVAKGLSEAAGLPVFAVSRLAVLAQGMEQGFVALDAGRGEVYARDVRAGREFLCNDSALVECAGDQRVLVAEESLLERLTMLRSELRPLDAGAALPVVIEQLPDGGADVVSLDAYYLREESGIYQRAGAAKAVAP